MRAYIAEFIGTCIFTATVLAVTLSASDLAPLTIGAALMAMVYASAHLSGAHFNPAISLAAVIRGTLAIVDVVPYFAAQLLGAFAAYLLMFGTYGDQLDLVSSSLDLGGLVVAAFLAELVFTFALVWVYLSTMTSSVHAGNSFYGLAIGGTVAAGTAVAGPISGAALNPVVAFALSLAGIFAWKWLAIYVFAQLLGATLAAVAFLGLNPDARDIASTSSH
ncbi:MAG: aquaporin [Nocardioidaceae bacterium]